MILHRYLLRFTTFKLLEWMKHDGKPFGLPDIERTAKEKDRYYEQEVTAFTAEDALTQLRAGEGGSLGQPPFVFAIVPMPDTETQNDGQRYERFCRCVQCGKEQTVIALCKSGLAALDTLPEGWSRLNRPGVVPGDYCGPCSKRIREVLEPEAPDEG